MLMLSLYTTQAPKGERQRNTLNSTLCSSRKYPYPHHGGNWKFQRGGGGQSPRKFQRGWGVRGEIFVQRVGSRSTFFVCQLAPLTYFTAVSFFERFKRLKTSHSLKLFAKPFWGLNIGLAN